MRERKNWRPTFLRLLWPKGNDRNILGWKVHTDSGGKDPVASNKSLASLDPPPCPFPSSHPSSPCSFFSSAPDLPFFSTTFPFPFHYNHYKYCLWRRRFFKWMAARSPCSLILSCNGVSWWGWICGFGERLHRDLYLQCYEIVGFRSIWLLNLPWRKRTYFVIISDNFQGRKLVNISSRPTIVQIYISSYILSSYIFLLSYIVYLILIFPLYPCCYDDACNIKKEYNVIITEKYSLLYYMR